MRRNEPDLHIAGACLHTARQTLLDQIAGERGESKRRLKVVLAAVEDALAAVARRGLTSEEYFAGIKALRIEAARANGLTAEDFAVA